jgi:hypothetical protein
MLKPLSNIATGARHQGAMKRRIPLITLAAVLGCGVLLAKSLVNALNLDRNQLAIKGYDAVAYFEQNRTVKGSPDFVYE